MKQPVHDWIRAHRRLLAGAAVTLAAALCLAWVGYSLHHACKNVSQYEIVHDAYVEKQGLYPADPAAGLTQVLRTEPGVTLYGVRLMFVTGGRVAQGSLTVQMLSGETLLATSVSDMTALLDGAFVDILFDRPVVMQQGQAYRLAITAAPAAPEDAVGLVYGEGAMADPALPLADALSPDQPGRTAALQYITNYTGTRFALKAFAPLAALVLLAVAGGWWLLFVKRAKAHWSFAYLAALLGLAFALVTPPLAGPDEYVHAAGAYALASQLTGQAGVESAYDENGVYRSQLAMRACDAPHMRAVSGEIGAIAYKEMADGLFSAGNSGALTTAVSVRAPYNVQPVQYLPQALGMLLARALGLGFYAMLLLGRLANLAVYVALAALAVRFAPAGKNIFFAVGLLPMCLALAGSLSADTAVLGLAFLLSALCLRGACEQRAMSLGAQACVLVLAALLAPAKAIYILLVGLCFFIRPENLGGRARSRAYKGLVCAAALGGWVLANGATVAYMFRSVDVERLTLALTPLAVLAALAAMAWLRWRKSPAFRRGAVIGGAVLAAVLAAVAVWVAGNSGEALTPEEYAAGIQPNGESVYVFSAGYIISHLPQTFKLLANTLGRELPTYLQGLVGALPGEPIVYGLEISWTLTLGLLLVLLASCLRRQGQPPRLHGRGRWLLGGVCLGVTALMVLANVSWTPINSATVFGIQGRYLLPVLPLALLLLGECDTVCLKRDSSRGLRFCSAALAAATALESLVLFATA